MKEYRTGIAWLGVAPTDLQRTEFENRGLQLHVVASTSPIEALSHYKGAVFSLHIGNVREGCDAINRLGKCLLDAGLRIAIVAHDDATMGQAQKRLKGTSYFTRMNPLTAPYDHVVPEQMARYDAGLAPKLDLKIGFANNRPPLSQTDALLLQRAFADCSKIVLTELTGGRSDARVFAVHMTKNRGSLPGIWPQPRFAKIDRTDKIEREHGNYNAFAMGYIPFGLCPNVEDLVSGADRSLLMGDFIDKAEPLWDLVQRNIAGPAISSLFEETLANWRDQAYANAPVTGSVASQLQQINIIDPARIRTNYAENVEDIGIAVSPGDLWEALIALKNQQFRCAPVHGDLHGENVRVRNGQAILIDLASVTKDGPLTTDLAALETALAFELPAEDKKSADEFKNIVWQEEIDRIYAPDTFRHPPAPSEATKKYHWMACAVRQIRHMGIAVQSSVDEYETAVAVQLLRRCQWDGSNSADHFRRSHGYVVATRLVKDLMNRNGNDRTSQNNSNARRGRISRRGRGTNQPAG